MTTDLSKYDASSLPDCNRLATQHYAIVVADWNSEVTYAMADGAIATLKEHGVNDISLVHVPGTVELTYGASMLLQADHTPDAIIVIGCVVRGGTPHFDYVCQSVTQGVATINADGVAPVIFSVLTCDTMEQALERAGGKLGNKGVEGAVTAMQMANLKELKV